jgi:hypothetical protein
MSVEPPVETLSDEDLALRVRQVMAEMVPLEASIGRLRVQIQQLVSEQKRRERQQHLKNRMQVRTSLAEGRMPSLQQIAESSNDLIAPESTLGALRFFRESGTEVGLGYASTRTATVSMTNGSSTVAVSSISQIRSRYLEGWDFGTGAHAGVRIHIPNTRTEKLVPASELFVRPKGD